MCRYTLCELISYNFQKQKIIEIVTYAINECYRRLQRPRISTSTYFQGVVVATNSNQIARAHVWLANHQNQCEPIRRRD